MRKHFPEIDLGTDDLFANGYIYANISIFNHWLNEDEFAECDVITFKSAVESNRLEDYMIGEKKFFDLYKSLAHDGLICNRPGSLRKIEFNDSEADRIFVDSLREHRFMDVYFISESIRVMGRWDRTDLVFFENVSHIANFEKKVIHAGLFLLFDKRTDVIKEHL